MVKQPKFISVSVAEIEASAQLYSMYYTELTPLLVSHNHTKNGNQHYDKLEEISKLLKVFSHITAKRRSPYFHCSSIQQCHFRGI